LLLLQYKWLSCFSFWFILFPSKGGRGYYLFPQIVLIGLDDQDISIQLWLSHGQHRLEEKQSTQLKLAGFGQVSTVCPSYGTPTRGEGTLSPFVAVAKPR
jgi:hypothetical protein